MSQLRLLTVVMPICKGITLRGKACTRVVRRGEYCHSHKSRSRSQPHSIPRTSALPPNEQAFEKVALSYTKYVGKPLSQDTIQTLGALTLLLAADGNEDAATAISSGLSTFIRQMSKAKGKTKKVDLMLEFGASIYFLTKGSLPETQVSSETPTNTAPEVIVIDEPPPPYTPRAT